MVPVDVHSEPSLLVWLPLPLLLLFIAFGASDIFFVVNFEVVTEMLVAGEGIVRFGASRIIGRD